ncbi:MAG: hypothetical protein ABI112_06900, partial [Terracoccus sp.]
MGVLVRGGSGGAVIQMARTWMITGPAIAWTPSSEQIRLTVRRCLEAGLPGQATALRVLTGERAVRYGVELNLHPRHRRPHLLGALRANGVTGTSRRPLRGSGVPETATPGKCRCQRCGIEKPTKPTRRPPELCADCKSVLRGLPAMKEETADESPDPNAHDDDPGEPVAPNSD